MRYSVSDTAEYGDYSRGPRVINETVREEMEDILVEIQDGSFAREWILENMAGRPMYNAIKRQEADHMIETVGKQLRDMMPWLGGAPGGKGAGSQVPLEQRAKELGVPGQVIRRLFRQGRISGTKVGGRIYVPADLEVPYRKHSKGKKKK